MSDGVDLEVRAQTLDEAIPAGIPHFISLGAGVQSSTLLFMAAEGLIQPTPLAAIIADTQDEPERVYAWLTFLLSLELPFPILVRTAGNLMRTVLKRHVSKKSGNRYIRTIIPAYLLNPDGSRGVLQRRCTGDYKIRVLERTISQELLPKLTKYEREARKNGEVERKRACSWIGISTDEADRMKPAKLDWIVNRWPLIELGINREGCKEWVRQSRYHELIIKAGFTEPPRSACKKCPYHSDAEWLRIKSESPAEFEDAVQWERAYQTEIVDYCQVTKGIPFLHNSLVPLDQVVFKPDKNRRAMSNECEGMCGV
jgi:hypothetical protein